MKSLLVILSAAVVVGLSVYAAFNALNLFAVTGQSLVMQIDSLVWLIASLTVGAASLALVLRWSMVRNDRSVVRELEERVARIERRTDAAA